MRISAPRAYCGEHPRRGSPRRPRGKAAASVLRLERLAAWVDEPEVGQAMSSIQRLLAAPIAARRRRRKNLDRQRGGAFDAAIREDANAVSRDEECGRCPTRSMRRLRYTPTREDVGSQLELRRRHLRELQDRTRRDLVGERLDGKRVGHLSGRAILLDSPMVDFPARWCGRRAAVVALSHFLLVVALALFATAAQAAVGLTEIAGTEGDGIVTVYYPSAAEAQSVKQGRFDFQLARDGAPRRGNGRLIVISHGSGGAPWVHADLARVLVDDGFVVAMPTHRGDNYADHSTPGPGSWQRRPGEVSRAIDVVGQDPRFGPLLKLDRVGMYGFSAGGHTALSLAGGRWSPARLTEHCESHISEDFQTCVGLAARLNGNVLDGLKTTIALWVIRYRFRDATWRTHSDSRIAAVVAACPFAADFDMASLAAPRVPLALVTAPRDMWLIPRFHGERVLQACSACERLADIPNAGHGALLSPLPPNLSGLLGDLLNDPPGFDRGVLPDINRKIAVYFRKHLLGEARAPVQPSA